MNQITATALTENTGIEDTSTEATGTTDTSAATSNAEVATAEAPATGVRLQYVDAREVVIGANVRTDVKLTREFVASIKRHGVIIPVIGHPTEDGRIRIEEGQRRTLGAIEAERYEMPAYVVPENDTETMRIIRQVIANEHRAGLEDSERIAAWKQLELDGMTPTAIARELAVQPKRIKTGLAVARNELAATAVSEHQIGLDHALVLIEFEDDEKALTSLRETARKNPSRFDHEAQQLRDRRETAQELARLTESFTARGVRIIDWPSWSDTSTAAVTELQDKEGTAQTVEGYEGRAGHGVAIQESWRGIEFEHFVTDFKSHGLRKISRSGPAASGWTEEEKAARKTLIANNKAWRSAQKVRREWLIRFLSRKAMPKTLLPFAATVMAEHRAVLGRALSDGNTLAHELLGFVPRFGSNALAELLANPAKTPHVIGSVTLAALEEDTSTNTWRDPRGGDVAYFAALKGWGYALSDVENIVLGIASPTAAAVSEVAESADAAAEANVEKADEPAPDTDADDADPDATGVADTGVSGETGTDEAEAEATDVEEADVAESAEAAAEDVDEEASLLAAARESGRLVIATVGR